MQISEEAKQTADEDIVYSEYINISKKPGLKQLSEHSSEHSINTHLKKV